MMEAWTSIFDKEVKAVAVFYAVVARYLALVG